MRPPFAVHETYAEAFSRRLHRDIAAFIPKAARARAQEHAPSFLSPLLSSRPSCIELCGDSGSAKSACAYTHALRACAHTRMRGGEMHAILLLQGHKVNLLRLEQIAVMQARAVLLAERDERKRLRAGPATPASASASATAPCGSDGAGSAREGEEEQDDEEEQDEDAALNAESHQWAVDTLSRVLIATGTLSAATPLRLLSALELMRQSLLPAMLMPHDPRAAKPCNGDESEDREADDQDRKRQRSSGSGDDDDDDDDDVDFERDKQYRSSPGCLLVVDDLASFFLPLFLASMSSSSAASAPPMDQSAGFFLMHVASSFAQLIKQSTMPPLSILAVKPPLPMLPGVGGASAAGPAAAMAASVGVASGGAVPAVHAAIPMPHSAPMTVAAESDGGPLTSIPYREYMPPAWTGIVTARVFLSPPAPADPERAFRAEVFRKIPGAAAPAGGGGKDLWQRCESTRFRVRDEGLEVLT